MTRLLWMLAAMLVVLGGIETLAQFRPRVMSRRKMAPYLINLLLGGVAMSEGETTERPTGRGKAS